MDHDDDGRTSPRVPAFAGIAVAAPIGLVAWAMGVPSPTALALAGLGLLGGAAAAVLATRPQHASRADTRWTALLSSSASARETLAAVEQLTDPLAIEHRVTRAMRDVAGDAELELLRAPDGPRGILTRARPADPSRLVEAVRAGGLRTETGLLLPVRYGAQVLGALSVTGPVRGPALAQLRRFADLLAFRLQLHVLYAELAHRERLATIGTFAAALAHDLRSPLSSIRMAIQALGRHRPALGDDGELLDIATGEVQRLLALIGELLDLSRPIEVDPRPVDLRALVDEVVRRQAPAAQAARVTLRPEVDATVPTVAGDGPRLQRVLDNLVANAIAFSPPGADVRIRVRTDEGSAVLEVVDRGPGIDADDVGRLFDPFFSKREGGTGLGLATVDRIVRAHGGEVVVDTARGRGTTMAVRLPAARGS